MTTTSDEVIFTRVQTLADAQIMREIRNNCREYMTKSTVYITDKQQEFWFENIDKLKIKMFLMHLSYHGVAFNTIGFGYCRTDDDETYLTGGILEQYRGKGYGRILFKHLLDAAKEFNTRITLDVLNTNTRAEKLYRSIGFVPFAKSEMITRMEYKNDSAV